MINEHMMDLGSRRSTIRELFEYGNSDRWPRERIRFLDRQPERTRPGGRSSGDLRRSGR